MKREFPEWIRFFAGLILSALGSMIIVVVFLFTTFQTQSQAGQDRDQLDRRLDRMEKKLDAIFLAAPRK